VYGGDTDRACGRRPLGLCTLFVQASSTCANQNRPRSIAGTLSTIGSFARSSHAVDRKVSRSSRTTSRRAGVGNDDACSNRLTGVDASAAIRVTSISTSGYPNS
jgi:hypothetical protein